MESEKLLTMKDLCRLAGVERPTAEKWFDQQLLARFNVGKQGSKRPTWRIRESEWIAFLERLGMAD